MTSAGGPAGGNDEGDALGGDVLGRDDAARARDEQLDRWLAEYLDAQDEGRDIGERLLAQAGPLRAELETRLGVQRRLGDLSREFGGTQAPALGEQFGRFTVREPLGRGGLSRVYRATDPDLEREVALKVLRHTQVLNRGQRDWIQNEARALARLEHPGIVRVHEVGEIEGQSYLSMELLPGPTLETLIACWAADPADGRELPTNARAAAERLRPVRARLALLLRLAEALVHCHAHGILHRDVKPGNVLLDADGNPKWIDFGLAHRPVPGKDASMGLTLESLAGTPAYLAPEQVESERAGADPRSDQFSFGTLCYECFALENPFLRDSRPAIQDAVARAEPPPLSSKARDVPPDLARVIHHALARDPGARYPSMAALAADLRALLADRPISVSEPSLAHIGRLWLRRHRRGVLVATLAATLALGVALTLWSLDTRRTHGALLDELAAIRPEAFEIPAELDRTIAPLQELQQRAADFERGPVRRRLFGALAPEVDATVHAWSRRLGELLQRDQLASEASGLVLQDRIYRRLLVLEERLCPTCPYNVASRGRGRVSIPMQELAGREVRLSRLTLLSDVPVLPVEGAPQKPGPDPFDIDRVSAFRPAQFGDELVAGTYRLHVWEPGAPRLLYETVFFVPDGWPAAQTLTLTPPRDEVYRQTVEVAPLEYDLLGGRGILRVPAYRMGKDPVTTAEIAGFLAETDETGAEFLANRAPEEPAAVSYDLAMRYAAWAGGRLPTRVELLHADASGALDLPDQPSTLIGGEYVLDLAHPFASLDPSRCVYGEMTLLLVSPRDRLSPGGRYPDTRAQTFCGFRLTFPSAEPALYEQLLEKPIEK